MATNLPPSTRRVYQVVFQTQGLETSVRQIQSATQSIERALLTLRTIGLTLLGGYGITAIVDTADAYQVVANKLKLVADNADQAEVLFRRLLGISNQTATSIEANVSLLQQVGNTIGRQGRSLEDSLEIVEAIALAGRLGGQATESVNQAIRQLSQAFSSGKLQGEEFTSVSENLRPILDALRKEFPGQLEKLRSEGKLTTQVLTEVLLKYREEWKRTADSLPLTIGQALVRVRNQFVNAQGTVVPVLNLIAEGVSQIAQNLELAAKLVATLAAIRLTGGAGGIGSFLSGMAAAALFLAGPAIAGVTRFASVFATAMTAAGSALRLFLRPLTLFTTTLSASFAAATTTIGGFLRLVLGATIFLGKRAGLYGLMFALISLAFDLIGAFLEAVSAARRLGMSLTESFFAAFQVVQEDVSGRLAGVFGRAIAPLEGIIAAQMAFISERGIVAWFNAAVGGPLARLAIYIYEWLKALLIQAYQSTRAWVLGPGADYGRQIAETILGTIRTETSARSEQLRRFLIDSLLPALENLVNEFQQRTTQLVIAYQTGGWSSVWRRMFAFGTADYDAIKNYFASMYDAIVQQIGVLLNRLAAKLGSFGEWAIDLFRRLFDPTSSADTKQLMDTTIKSMWDVIGESDRWGRSQLWKRALGDNYRDQPNSTADAVRAEIKRFKQENGLADLDTPRGAPLPANSRSALGDANAAIAAARLLERTLFAARKRLNEMESELDMLNAVRDSGIFLGRTKDAEALRRFEAIEQSRRELMDFKDQLREARASSEAVRELGDHFWKLTEKIADARLASQSYRDAWEKVNAVLEAAKTPIQRAIDEMRELDSASTRLRNTLTVEEQAIIDAQLIKLHYRTQGVIGGIKAAYVAVKESVMDSFQLGETLFNMTFDAVDRMLTNFVESGKLKFRDFANSLIADISRIILRWSLLQLMTPLVQAFSGSQISQALAVTETLKASRGSPMAQGGIVSSRTLALVGEAGPEAVLPLRRDGQGNLGVAASGVAGAAAAAPVVNVQVINNSQSRVTAEQNARPDGLELRFIVEDVIERGLSRGRFDAGLRENFGIARRGRS